MRTLLWTTALLLLCAAAALIIHLLMPKPGGSLLPNLNLADWVAVVSLALNAALFVITIISLAIAVAAYKASEKSGELQLQTLGESRAALQRTADTLEGSATHFRESAEAAKGQFAFLQNEKRDREAAVLATMVRELSSNETATSQNKTALEAELEALKGHRSLIGPLAEIHIEAWELLRIYLPPQIGGNQTVLHNVTETYGLTLRLKELIRSREEYRIHNGAMTNFWDRMKFYDEQLLELNGKTSEHLGVLLHSLESAEKVKPPPA